MVFGSLKPFGKRLFTDTRFVLFKARRRALSALRGTATHLPLRPLPVNRDGRVLLHLGCGSIDAPGFINIDARPAPHLHFVLDARNLTPVSDDGVDLVYACHVLEHYPANEHRQIVWEWARVLRPGGTLRLSVPGFDELLRVYEQEGRDVESIVGPLLGYDDGYNAHCHIFNFPYLEAVLLGGGLKNVRRWEPGRVADHDFEDWASKTVHRRSGDYVISLNIEATKGASTER